MIDPSWIQAGSQVLGSAVAKPPNQNISSVSSPSSFDNSGWTVATGSAKANGGGFQLPWYAWVLVGYAAVVWLEKKK